MDLGNIASEHFCEVVTFVNLGIQGEKVISVAEVNKNKEFLEI